VLYDVHKHGVLVPAQQLTVSLVNHLGDEQTKEGWKLSLKSMTSGSSYCDLTWGTTAVRPSRWRKWLLASLRWPFCIWFAAFSGFIGFIAGDEFRGIWFGRGWLMYGNLGIWLRPCAAGMQPEFMPRAIGGMNWWAPGNIIGAIPEVIHMIWKTCLFLSFIRYQQMILYRIL